MNIARLVRRWKGVARLPAIEKNYWANGSTVTVIDLFDMTLYWIKGEHCIILWYIMYPLEMIEPVLEEFASDLVSRSVPGELLQFLRSINVGLPWWASLWMEGKGGTRWHTDFRTRTGFASYLIAWYSITVFDMVSVSSLSIVNEGGAALWPRDLEHWATTCDQRQPSST